MNPGPSEKLRVLLIGCGPTAFTALRSLLLQFHVVGVLRDIEGEGDEVLQLAQSSHVPIWPPGNSLEIAEVIEKTRPDAVVISSFRRILSPDLLRLSRFVNVHYSPLPRYRGRANVNWALINGDCIAGISIHQIDPGLDSGNLLYQQEIDIEETDTVGTLYDRLNAIQERELADTVLRLLAGDEGIPQDHSHATYGCTRVPSDGEIDWRSSTCTIDRLIRALASPFPGAFTYHQTRRWIVSRAVPVANVPIFEGRVPGRVIERSPSQGWVDVLTGDGVLRILEFVDESRSAVSPASILKSTRATLGLSIHELLERIQVLEQRIATLTESA